MPRVDTHAHVFHRGLKAIASARYVPTYDASLDDYFGFLSTHGIERGVLVQPSFLGSDNGLLVECLAEARGRLAGVVVIDEPMPEAAVVAMAEAGVVGLRCNLIGRLVESVAEPGFQSTLRLAERLGWHLELHADQPDLARALVHLDGFGGPILIDHFGRPARSPAERAAVLAWQRDPRIHVKLSAPYRLAGNDAPTMTPRLIEAFGTDRLLWGSDWPWTQFEDRKRAVDVLPEALGLDAEAVQGLDRTAIRLFFGGQD